MNHDEAMDLIEKLDGDEHAWVDLKEDYYIGGIANNEAEFIRDIASLANTITDKRIHRIIVGVNDEGDLVGISPGEENYNGNGPRHIFSFDESDIQQILDSNLNPLPYISWETFEEGTKKFGILSISPLEEPPTVVAQDVNDSNGNRLLHNGLIFVRKGSGKVIAQREELENLIDYRIRRQREQILDGIHKAVEIGPEWMDRLAQAVPEDGEIPLSTSSEPDEGDIQFAQRMTREPASTLDAQLNEDISQWKHRGDDFIEYKPLLEYYANPNELTLDDVALKFLTQASIKNRFSGIFWLYKASDSLCREILVDTPDNYRRLVIAAKVILLLNDESTLDNLLQDTKYRTSHGDLKRCMSFIGDRMDTRVDFLLKQDNYNLEYNSWTSKFTCTSLSEESILELIPEIMEKQFEIIENSKPVDIIEQMRNAVWDLEIALGKHKFKK